jgi:hypothetical protein
MPKLIVVLEPKLPTDIYNLLNGAQSSQVLPEGVQEVLGTSFVVEFPKGALFLAKILVTADGNGLKYRVFEIATGSAWEFQNQETPKS